jgi:hypothetical protein
MPDKYVKVTKPIVMCGSEWPPPKEESIWRRIKLIKFKKK